MPTQALLDTLAARLAEAGHSAESCAAVLREGQAELKRRFDADEPIADGDLRIPTLTGAQPATE